MSQSVRSRSFKHFLLRAEAGAAGGLIGAVAVALIFLVEGAIQMQPLAVPSALTSAWFAGASEGTSAASGWGADIITILQMVVYSIAHLITFAVVGVTAVFVVEGSTFWKSVATGAIYAGIACTGLLFVVGTFTGNAVALDVLGLHRVLLANLLAGAIIGGALYVAEHGGDADEAT